MPCWFWTASASANYCKSINFVAHSLLTTLMVRLVTDIVNSGFSPASEETGLLAGKLLVDNWPQLEHILFLSTFTESSVSSFLRLNVYCANINTSKYFGSVVLPSPNYTAEQFRHLITHFITVHRSITTMDKQVS